MKYVVLLGDGMSDKPVPELSGRTPLMAAHTPNLDRMVRDGVGGWSLNTPKGYYPGSDVANLGVLGYDVTQGYTGRSPLEAAAMGVVLGTHDLALRCNLVTLDEHFGRMVDFSAGHISTTEAAVLVSFLDRELGTEAFRFYPGVSYRHLLVWQGGRDDMKTVPPHDISDQLVHDYLPSGPDAAAIRILMEKSQGILWDHKINRARIADGKKPANSVWLWGQGRKPRLPLFTDLHGKTGGMISAVDLMQGIAAHIGFERFTVPGATGWLDTHYEGKVAACLEGLRRHDLMFVHVEAPDEAGHEGRLDYKIQAIEDFDRRLVGPILAELEKVGNFRVLALPDHPTPVASRTHNSDPVPFALVGEGVLRDGNSVYDESLLTKGTLFFDPGYRLMSAFLGPQPIGRVG
ncbi:MAG TPA: cofactor-independent phosphoglycerate mutase [Magnetococcales bacterium]|nr:cofactor-independent phosphoglycerate mutase [Magnetococcales bacterium]